MIGVGVAFEWNKEPTDFGSCDECKQLILSDMMHTWNAFIGNQIIGRRRLCEECYKIKPPPEYLIVEEKISRCNDEQTFNFTAGAVILSVISRDQNDVYLIVLVDNSERDTEYRKIYTSISHRPLKAPITRYIGSVFIFSGKGVLHVYE